MRDRDYSASSDFLKRLFGETLHKVELRVIPNVRGEGRPSFKMIGSCDEAGPVCETADRPGYATYFGVCTRNDASRMGCLGTVAECPALWVDIDCVKEGLSGDQVISCLEYLPHPPTMIVNSGGGLHAYWLLEEPVNVTGEAAEQVTSCLRQLALILAGDMQCAELARIMRLPGTMNSKAATVELYGEPFICEVLSDTGHVHDIDTLSEWLSTQRVILKGSARSKTNPVREDDPFVAYARSVGFEPSIDIEADLAAMGDGNIHETQLRVSMSMIARGYDDDDIVTMILAATEQAAPSGAKWNWRREEEAIRGMIRSGRAKAVRNDRTAGQTVTAQQARTNGNAALKLVHDADKEAEPVKRAKGARTNTVAIGHAAVGVWKERHGPVIHTQGTTWVYEDGIWAEWQERHAQRLRAIIQEACAAIGVEPKTSLLSAARAYFMDRPELYKPAVEFDRHGLLVAEDGCIDLTSFEVVPHSPKHYATHKIAASLAGDRDHPALDSFLSEVFHDREDRAAIISTVQEWFGTAIVPLPRKPRSLLKGLLVHGPSRCGKTQLSELARWLLGHDFVCGSRMADLSDRFGREPLIGRRGWIADDAIGEAETLDAETYKVVVTGERTSAMRKGGKNWEGRFGIPVMLTANNMPRVKDQSDATFNRSLILSMTYSRPEDAPEPPGYTSISEKIGKEELTGLLWWAIEGWRRLAARGMFAPPGSMTEAVKSFKDDNNPVGAWLAQCTSHDPENKVARLDIVASYNGWRTMEHDDAKPWGSNTITRRLTAIMPHLKQVKLNGEKCFGGIRLNDEGLFAWQRTKDNAGYEKKPTFSECKEDVNRFWAKQQREAGNETDDAGRRPKF